MPRHAVVELEVPGQVGDEELGGVGVPGDLGDGGQGARGTTHLHREAQRAHVVARVEQAGEPLGGLEAEGDRDGVLGQRAPGHHVVAVPPGQGDERLDLPVQVDEQVTRGETRLQDERGVEHVLAGQPAVQPRRPDVAGALTQHRHERDDRVAAPLGLGGDRALVVGDPQVVEPDEVLERLAVGVVRSDAGAHERVVPLDLDLEHRLEQEPLAEDRPGSLVAGPEQVGHQAPA